MRTEQGETGLPKRGRGRPKGAGEMVPKTAYQEWIQPLLSSRGLTTDDLAQSIGRQQSIVWRVVNGDPIKYPSAKRPGYELAYEIGNALGLLAESLAAAGHSLVVAR